MHCSRVIERKVLIVSLFANASDYSNNTCIFCKIQAHTPVYASPVGVVTCVREEQYDFYLSPNTFLPSTCMATTINYGSIRTYEYDVTTTGKPA